MGLPIENITKEKDPQREAEKQYTILHVDDNIDFTMLFFRQFRKLFNVISVNSAQEAVEKLQTQIFDAVITDYEMPVMNGLEFLKILKRDYPNIPVIFYTGQGNEEIAREAFISGAADYFVKNLGEFAHKEKLNNSIRNAIEKEQAKEALRTSEERYRNFVQNFQGIAVVNDINFNPIFLYGAVEDITGFTDKDFITGQPRWEQIVHPEDLADIKMKRGRLKSIPGYTLDHQYRIINKKGQIIWLHEIMSNICDSLGNPIIFQGAAYDVTRHKKAEERINHLNLVLQAIKRVDQIIIREGDREELIKQSCKNLIETRGYDFAWLILTDENENVISSHYDRQSDVFHINDDFIKSKGLTQCIKRALHSKKVIRLEHSCGECEQCFLEKTFSKHSVLISRLENQDKVYGALVVSIPPVYDYQEEYLFLEMAGDIAYALRNIETQERHNKIMEELRRERDFNKSILEASPAYFVALNPDESVKYMNEAILKDLGYTIDEVIGKDYKSNFIPQQDWKHLSKTFQDITQEKLHTVNSHLIIAKSGETFMIRMNGRPIINDKGQLESFFGMGFNITKEDQYQQAIEDAAKSYQEIFNSVDEAIFVQTVHKGEFIDFNRKACEMFGLKSKEEAIGQRLGSLVNFVHPYTAKESVKYYNKALAGEDVNTEWKTIIKKTGKELWLDVTLKRLYLMGQECILGIWRDITPAKEAENALRESEELYRSLFNDAPAAIAITTLDGKICVMNSKLEDMFGTMEDINSTRIPYVNPEDRKEIIKIITKTKYIDKREVQFYNRQGDIIDCVLSMRLVQIKGEPRLLTLAQNITEQKKWEEELKNSEEKYRNLVETASDIVFICNLLGQLSFVNSAFKNMFDKDDSKICRRLVDLALQEDRDLFDCSMIKRLNNGEKKITFEARMKDKNGDIRIMQFSCIPLKNVRRQIIGVTGIGHDITEIKQMEQAFINTNKELHDFAYMASHELKSPMNIIKGYLSILKEEPEMLEQYSVRISFQIDRLLSFVNSLLNLSAAGKILGEREKVDLEPLIRKVAEESKPEGISLNLQIETPLDSVYGDPKRIEIAIKNLIENSIKYRNLDTETVEIKIGCIKDEKNLTLSIKDNGSGISYENMDKIFQAGFTMGANEGGTGFGLSIVKKIISAHRGKIWATSEGQGKGSQFHIKLPLWKKE